MAYPMFVLKMRKTQFLLHEVMLTFHSLIRGTQHKDQFYCQLHLSLVLMFINFQSLKLAVKNAFYHVLGLLECHTCLVHSTIVSFLSKAIGSKIYLEHVSRPSLCLPSQHSLSQSTLKN